MKFKENKRYTIISIYVLIVFICCLLIYQTIFNWEETVDFLKKILRILTPFIAALFFAYFINPMMMWLENHVIAKIRIGKLKIQKPKLKRSLSILLSYVFIIGVIMLLLGFIVPELKKSLKDLVDILPDSLEEINIYFNQLMDSSISHSIPFDTETIYELINNNIANFDKIPDLLAGFVPDIISFTLTFASTVINILLAFIIAIYLLMSKESFISRSKKIIIATMKSTNAVNLIHVLKESNRIFSQFFIGKFLDSLIIGILCFIILIITRMPYPLLISSFVGITNIIPYFGPFVGGGIGFILVLIVDPVQALWFLVIILGIQQFDGNILGPKILGDSTGLSPFWVIFAILIGGKLFGFIGMFLGVPFFAVIKNLVDRHIDKTYTRKITQITEIKENV